MNLVDTLEQDWHRYFHNGMMWDRARQEACLLSVDGSLLMAKYATETQIPVAANLASYWAESRALNLYNNGFYVARTAYHGTRRTGSMQSYQITWTPPDRRLVMDGQIFRELLWPKPYPSLNKAWEMLSPETWSVAISKNLILYRTRQSTKKIILMFRDAPLGTLPMRSSLLTPEFADGCLMKLARAELMEVGIVC